MKISIIGSNGFLSTAIAKYANKQKWELDIYGLETPKNHEYNNFVGVNLVNYNMDCTGLLTSDIIIYAVGAGIQSNLNESADLIFRLNVTVPVYICNQLSHLSYKGIFVTFGSVFEVGESSGKRPFTEEDIITSLHKAPNNYTVSKRMLTRYISSYKHSFTHWHFIIPTIYGAGENPKRLIPYTINAIKEGQELHFTSGEQTRQYIHVSEIPFILELSYNNSLDSGIYNIEGRETITVKEIVEIIHSSLGKPLPSECFGTVKRSDTGMQYLALNGQKLRDKTGFVASKCIKEVISTY